MPQVNKWSYVALHVALLTVAADGEGSSACRERQHASQGHA